MPPPPPPLEGGGAAQTPFDAPLFGLHAPPINNIWRHPLNGNIVAPPFKDRSPLRRSLDFESFSFLPSFPSSPHLSSPSLPFSLVFVILFPLLPPLLSRLFLLLTYLPSSSIPSPPFFTISSLFSVFFFSSSCFLSSYLPSLLFSLLVFSPTLTLPSFSPPSLSSSCHGCIECVLDLQALRRALLSPRRCSVSGMRR